MPFSIYNIQSSWLAHKYHLLHFGWSTAQIIIDICWNQFLLCASSLRLRSLRGYSSAISFLNLKCFWCVVIVSFSLVFGNVSTNSVPLCEFYYPFTLVLNLKLRFQTFNSIMRVNRIFWHTVHILYTVQGIRVLGHNYRQK